MSLGVLKCEPPPQTSFRCLSKHGLLSGLMTSNDFAILSDCEEASRIVGNQMRGRIINLRVVIIRTFGSLHTII